MRVTKIDISSAEKIKEQKRKRQKSQTHRSINYVRRSVGNERKKLGNTISFYITTILELLYIGRLCNQARILYSLACSIS